MIKKVTASLVLGLLATACASGGGSVKESGYGKSFNYPSQTRIPEEIEKNYAGSFKIGKPYAIQGKWYYPRYDEAYDEVGIASWYGPGFHGKRTANGEIFDENGFTAAHPVLPLPSKVMVTNLENGVSAIVRVNDRGPFKEGRIIDLSKRSAQRLGIHSTAKVRVRYLKEETERMWSRRGLLEEKQEEMARLGFGSGYAEPISMETVESAEVAPIVSSNLVADSTMPESLPAVSSGSRAVKPLSSAESRQSIDQNAVFDQASSEISTPMAVAGKSYIQAAAFSMKENAYTAASRLSGIAPADVVPVTLADRTMYRVKVGPFKDEFQVTDALKKVISIGFADARVINVTQ